MIPYQQILEQYHKFYDRYERWKWEHREDPVKTLQGETIKEALEELHKVYDECYDLEVRASISDLICRYHSLTCTPVYQELKEKFQEPIRTPSWILPPREEEIPVEYDEAQFIESVSIDCETMLHRYHRVHDISCAKKGNGALIREVIRRLQEKLKLIFESSHFIGITNLEGETQEVDSGVCGGLLEPFDIFVKVGSEVRPLPYERDLIANVFVLWVICNVYTIDFDKEIVEKISKYVPGDYLALEKLYSEEVIIEPKANPLLHFVLSVMVYIRLIVPSTTLFPHYHLTKIPRKITGPGRENVVKLCEEASARLETLIKKVNEITIFPPVKFDKAVLDGVDELCNKFDRFAARISKKRAKL